MQYETATATRRGDRDINQDRCAILTRDTAHLLLLADGMGGHPRGEMAAQVYIDSMSRAFAGGEWPQPAPGHFLTTAMNRAHADIITAGLQERPPVSPMTTGVACLVQNGTACWGHVGDSRLYLFRDGRAATRTRDHSLVEEDIARGAWPEAERGQHPYRNIVLRSLGADTNPPNIEVVEPVGLRCGDVVLLCSDGLWSVLPEATIGAAVVSGDLDAAVRRLALEAEAAGRPYSDNVTLAVLRLSSD